MPVPVSITPTELPGVLEMQVRKFSDARGYFIEAYNQVTWAAEGFNEDFKQDCLSQSCRGTLRGMHYQLEPHGMGKLVRVVQGAVFDVAVDLRRGSPTFGKWVGRELSGENGVMLWIPSGFAHGFVALEDNTLVYYKCTSTYTPQAERSVSYKDPEIGIQWPMPPGVITEKDEAAPLLRDAEYNFVYAG